MNVVTVTTSRGYTLCFSFSSSSTSESRAHTHRGDGTDVKVRGLLLNRPQLHSITLLPLSRMGYIRFTRSLVLKKTSRLQGQPCETPHMRLISRARRAGCTPSCVREP